MRSRSFSTRAGLATIALMCVVVFGVATAQDRRASTKEEISSETTDTKEKREPFVPGELLVKFSGGGESEAAFSANRAMGSKVLEDLADTGWQRVQLADGVDVKSAANEYTKFQGVEYAQPNFYYHLLATPNDPQFTSSGMYGLTKISAPAAWDLSTGSSTVVVADIDTGMRYTHQDLAPNAWTNPGEIPGNGIDDDGDGFIDDVHGWDFFYNDSDPIDDAGGHGTHTAGTIGAAGNNALNVVGVNWNVKIMPIKIYSPAGTDSTSAMLVNAYAYIRMMKLRGVNIRATNNSYGNCGEACGYDQATKDGIDAMGEAGIVSCFAAGNDNNNNDTNPAPSYPSVYTSPSIIAVASSTSTDTKSSFSSYGLTTVDLAAPGSNVLSTWNTSDTATNTISGTSMATPHVTGAVALLSAYRPDLSVASLKASILNNVDILPAWSGIVKTGGRLNIFHAMQNPTVCTFNTPSGLNVLAPGGSYSINVTSPVNCDYMIKSNVSWITFPGYTIPGSYVLSGNGTVNIQVAAMPSGRRTGTITIGGQTFTVRQTRKRIS